MVGRRLALVIGNNYPNSDKELGFAVADATKMKEILLDKNICCFDDVVLLVNKTSKDASFELEKLFTNTHQNDLIFIYFSGHGKKDFTNNLCLLFEDTNEELLLSTSLYFDFINKCLKSPQALKASVIIVLDCSYSGVAGIRNVDLDVIEALEKTSGLGAGIRDADLDVIEALEKPSGPGTIILTSTGLTGSSTAKEDEKLRHGVFTYYLIEGLEKGNADRNGDGYISIYDLYKYAFEMTIIRGSQSPMMKGNIEGNIFIGKNPRIIREKEYELKKSRLLEEFISQFSPRILDESLTILRKNYENLSLMGNVEIEIYRLLESFLEGELPVENYITVLQHLKEINIKSSLTEVEARIIKQYIFDSRLSESLNSIRQVMEFIWANDALRIVKNYTDHGEEHSVRVIGFIERLLQANLGTKFSEQEIYLLLAGVYLHDIGMQCDIIKYPEIKKKAERLGAKFDVKFAAKTANDYSFEEQKEILKNHHFLSVAWVEYLYETKNKLLSYEIRTIPSDLLNDLMDICKFHSMLPINDCPHIFDNYPNNRKKMVASILRLADELDISSTRVNLDTIKIFSQGEENSVYWWLHNHSKVNFVNSNKVLLYIRLHPEDFELYSSLVHDNFIINFKSKIQPVLDVLTGYKIPILIDNNSRVILHNYANRLPTEITAVLDKQKEASGNTEISKTFTSSATGMEFILIPAGKFIMGSPSDEEGRYNNEDLAHELTIKNSFYMGKYPVTQKQWEKIMRNNPSHFRGEDRPVEMVSWKDAKEFVTKLNEKEGTDKYRLPSEAEWEYACRAGTQTRYFFGDNASKLNEYAWYTGNSDGKTHSIGQKKPNPWGLYDMYGNIWEWVQDEWHKNYSGTPLDGTGWEDGVSSNRIARGGGWRCHAEDCRSAFRGTHFGMYSDEGLGFRLLKETIKNTEVARKKSKNIGFLEDEARTMVANERYLEAGYLLKEVIDTDTKSKFFIENEFGFLYNFEGNIERDKERWQEKKELIKWQTSLWSIIAEKNKFSLIKSEVNEDLKIINNEPKEELIIVKKEEIFSNSKLTSQEKGEILEKAVIELFNEFFVIAENYEVKRQELRKQKAGLQFGFDISLECSLKENMNVKCHIECKNITETIKLAHIAEKLLQTKNSYPNTDHWILICPNTEPANELHQYVSQCNDTREFPFNIQIWSKNIVEDFFGLNPKVYDLFFEPGENEVHPSQWSPEKRVKVFEKWNDKLKPIIHLPIEWDNYIRESYMMCFKGENPKELDFLYKNHVQMECMDERKNILNKSMEEYVREWLNDNETPLMFLLGEFGDGKSVFTYIFSRKLAEEYYENPSDGWIPVRFTLREYCNTRNSQKFLKERLERFDANFSSWNKVKEKNKILVILDGFDELTKKLDSDSIFKHIKVLKECCDEFNNMKIIVTSRTHFLEKQRDKERLLQRLPVHCMCYLAPINRKNCLQYLGNSVDTSEDKQKLKNIEKMHDPIGLASKPLFLQMIRQTLNELPEKDLNEIILYKTYIKKSLRRKMELLDDDKMEVLPEEICSNLIEILESIAIKLQISNQEFICLAEEFSGQKEKDLAKRLWQISDSGNASYKNIEQDKTNMEDATARVGIRSLLTKVMTEKDDIKWPVDFCHRSMREYFVARGICSTLILDIGKAKELLEKLQLNPEILYFASEIMKENLKIYEEKLSQIISENRSRVGKKASVGNVVTLLYRLKGELPGEDWSYINLEGANLSGANLSGKNFSSTNLRNSCLDNVNFEMADFSECDLTGVRIEETSKVISIALHSSGSKIIAAYEDNIIREWKIDQRFKLEYRNLGNYKKGSIRQLFSYNGSDLCLLMNEEVIFYDYSNTDELKQKGCFKIKPEYRHVVAKKDGLVLLSEDEQQVRKLFYVNIQHKTLCSKEIEDLVACEILDQQAFIIATNNNINLSCARNYRKTVTLEVLELTSLCTFCLKKDEKYLIACGQRNGNVLVWRINISDVKFQYEPLLNSHIHDGIVSSVVFLDEMRIISSSLDHKISIQRFGEYSKGIQGTIEKTLYLSVRCRGMKIDGLKGEKERKMLEELILQAEKY